MDSYGAGHLGMWNTYSLALPRRISFFDVGKSCLEQVSNILRTLMRPVDIQPVLLLLCNSTLVLGLKLSAGSGFALIGGDDKGSAILDLTIC
jgi:hypothetical protein